MTFSPEVDPADAGRTAAFLKTLSDAELSQAIASPTALVGRLEGFTMNHLRTAAQDTVIGLARFEQAIRQSDRISRDARRAQTIAACAAAISLLSLLVAVFK